MVPDTETQKEHAEQITKWFQCCGVEKDKAGSRREKKGGKEEGGGGKLYTYGVDHQSAHFRFIIIPMISRTFS